MSSGSPSASSANTAAYTLPGVINYLTSEFTNLERFKIMTNLEKSEMKYKIVQLQGELNALKFVNGKQKAKIEKLEEEVRSLKSDHNTNDNDNNNTNGTDKVINDDPTSKETPLINIPDVDLQLIKNSRDHFTKNMTEIIKLFKIPNGHNDIHFLDIPELNDTDSEFDVLLQHHHYEPPKEKTSELDLLKATARLGRKNKSSITAKYFEENDSHTPPIKASSNPKAPKSKLPDLNEIESNNSNVQSNNDVYFRTLDPISSTSKSDSIDESDSETVIFDYANEGSPPITSSIQPPQDIVSKAFIHGNYTITISESSAGQNHSVLVKDKNQIIQSAEISISNVIFEKIVDIHPLFVDEDHQDTLIIIDKDGIIISFDLKQNEEKIIHNLTGQISDINACEWIEFDIKATTTSKSFGLAMSGSNGPNNQYIVKVARLIHDITTNTTESSLIGSFTKSFLATKGHKDIALKGWAVSSITRNGNGNHANNANNNNGNNNGNNNINNNNKVAQSPKAKKAPPTCDDPTLARYLLVFQSDDNLVHFNFVSKKFDTVDSGSK
ncbi:Striatin family-domain-containing protein [Scheffersomyces coipomensis]|uniref:Striatin family-domain-containing protein n=1 Tax=Scheffersomyces coipomensis TaxID=1788519 RepID=UPI00315C7B6D